MTTQDNKLPITFRLDRELIERLRNYTKRAERQWPPGPNQTEIISRGIALVLDQLETKRIKERA